MDSPDEKKASADFLGIIDLKKLENQIEEADAVLDTLQAQYRTETGRKHVWFK